ncbi:hypothetical protein EW145_g6916 [Phellinidium pouzarii]|uniref:BRCT domain-containing protein n=1 Tax=Phellinidium pouzarii TaxID=167371 RepID=A0A4S4KTQ0_9AGAM|nr:hypothetical protein EW145_g6916 [Phellinidium pouzarii]
MTPSIHRPPARLHADRNANVASTSAAPAAINDELFLEPMMGTPLAMYIEKDVVDRDQLVELIVKHGGGVSPGYSGVTLILVDPHTESGQSLYRQYAGKKGKTVLSSHWIHECISKGALQTYHTNWAGCKVNGTEEVLPRAGPSSNGNMSSSSAASRRARPPERAQLAPPATLPPPQPQAQVQPHPPPQQLTTNHATNFAHQTMQSGQTTMMTPATPLTTQNFSYSVYPGQPAQHHAARPTMPPPTAPSQAWHPETTSISSHQHSAHILLPQRSQNLFGRDDHWGEPGAGFPHMPTPTDTHNMAVLNDGHVTGYYDHRYREGQNGWADNSQDYYEPPQAYNPSYQPEQYVPLPAPSNMTPQPAPPASALVLNRRRIPARSPTPPKRVIKSTYGGNLFTADDVLYLKKYIDYCQEQGLVLSLREICERIAVKAPHHTFYSWRRYCNKHQIRLGGYAMDVGSRSLSPPARQENVQFAEVGEVGDIGEESEVISAPQLAPEGLFTIAAAQNVIQERGLGNRSPTPPRALFRSTTGKGVAFTIEDVAFLCKFMAYRKAQGRLDMVTFWKDVATKAPHHSRASWMKYYRRHKHELNRIEGDEPLPPPPPKKMRYGFSDDILLAQYFANIPEGTSDKVFQDFAKLNPHHPWKGWQEHHRIHKAKIDHLIQRINSGEILDLEGEDD